MGKIDWNLFETKDTMLEAAIVGIVWGFVIVTPLVVLAYIGRNW